MHIITLSRVIGFLTHSSRERKPCTMHQSVGGRGRTTCEARGSVILAIVPMQVNCCVRKICGIWLSAVSCKVVFNEDFHFKYETYLRSYHASSMVLQFAPEQCVHIYRAVVVSPEQYSNEPGNDIIRAAPVIF